MFYAYQHPSAPMDVQAIVLPPKGDRRRVVLDFLGVDGDLSMHFDWDELQKLHTYLGALLDQREALIREAIDDQELARFDRMSELDLA